MPEKSVLSLCFGTDCSHGETNLRVPDLAPFPWTLCASALIIITECLHGRRSVFRWICPLFFPLREDHIGVLM